MQSIEKRVAESFAAQGLMRTLGAELALVADGEVHIAMDFSSDLSQQHGYIHAGAITSIVDSACGYAGLTKAPDAHEIVSAEFKINFLRPALGERFLAIGKVQSTGRSLAVCTGEVRAFSQGSSDFKVVALMQATMVFVAITRGTR